MSILWNNNVYVLRIYTHEDTQQAETSLSHSPSPSLISPPLPPYKPTNPSLDFQTSRPPDYIDITILYYTAPTLPRSLFASFLPPQKKYPTRTTPSTWQ